MGVTFDVDYGGYNYAFIQAEVPGKTATENFKYKMSYNAINLMPMFRFTKEASFIEIGPQFQMVRNQSIEDMANPSTTISGSEYMSTRLTGLVFGFGGHIVGNEIIALMMGIRLNYVLSDLTHENWTDSNFPFGNYSGATPPITEHVKTTPLNVQITLEVNYSLGYIARSSSGCGKRAAFLSF